MTLEPVVTVPIELSYTLTADDLLDGVTAQSRDARRPWAVVLLTVAPVLGLAIGFVRAEVWEVSAKAVPKIVAVSLGVLVGGIALSFLLYWLMVRLLLGLVYRWQVRLILRGNPWLSHPIRATVTDSGIYVRNAATASTSTWSQYPLYVETDLSFVLMASKRRGAFGLVLPKRGLVNGDAAPLRTLLDAHCSRRA